MLEDNNDDCNIHGLNKTKLLAFTAHEQDDKNIFGHWHEIKHLISLTGGATPSCSCSKKSPAHCFVSITKYTCANKVKGVSEQKLLFCPTHLRELKLTRARRP